MIVIVMGVSGCGKTTVGRLLSEQLGWPFYDGDDYHSPANIEKMSHGIPLTDEDRRGWLATLTVMIRASLAKGHPAIFACSALKQDYRQELCVDPRAVRFVYLKGSYELILGRMVQRPGHYMKPDMLASQFAALEEPEQALTVEISLPPEEIVSQIMVWLTGAPAAA
jgi:gluconokinase